jgi:hypothetical protein
MKARWVFGFFGVVLRDDEPRRPTVGWFWRSWGVAGTRGVRRVYHIPSGCFLTSFGSVYRTRRDTFGARWTAKQFCEAIDHLADWTSSTPTDDPTVVLRMHALALRLTAGRPDLRVIDGGAP